MAFCEINQRVTNDRVILHLKLMAVFKDQQRIRLIGGGLGRSGRLRRMSWLGWR